MGKTRYRVFQLDPNTELWGAIDVDVEATSAKAAIRQTVEDAGEYVAVPERSWQPQSVKVETQKRLKIG